MEKSHFEAQFRETKKTLETSRARINEFLKQKTLDERDRVRLTRVLQRLGLPTYESRLSEMTDVEHIPDEEITAEEKALMEVLTAIDEYLPNNRPSEIKVYKRKSVDQKVAAGFADGINIHLLRETLGDFTRAADVYVHEKTHHNTGGAQDASLDFRNYLTFALGRIALDQLKKVRPDVL